MARGKHHRRKKVHNKISKSWFFFYVQQDVFNYLLDIAKKKGLMDNIPDFVIGKEPEHWVENFKRVIDTIVPVKNDADVDAIVANIPAKIL